ncbi:ATP-binding cassette domain-containing protein [Halobellus sp. GM3]|uniref:ATP-binding cassette domain-containing protein n=1 Tax=Halobellus sp. GM3 TaxID=3458410 RepID=UPI00403DBDEC
MSAHESQSAQTALLEVTDLKAGYGQLTIIDGITFSITEGEIISIVGPNGAGKTTLMNTLGGLLEPQGGSIVCKGTEISGLSPDERIGVGLSLVPERRNLFRNMTVRENLILGTYQNRDADRETLLAEVYDIFPRLKERTDQKAGTLSGGEAQMLTVSRSIMTDPDILLLDEPTIGLAPKLIPDLFDAIKQINENGVSVVLVEQRVEDSLRIADYGYLLENGRLTLDGTPDELLANDEIITRYLGGE